LFVISAEAEIQTNRLILDPRLREDDVPNGFSVLFLISVYIRVHLRFQY